jgi:hypothetical protein
MMSCSAFRVRGLWRESSGDLRIGRVREWTGDARDGKVSVAQTVGRLTDKTVAVWSKVLSFEKLMGRQLDSEDAPV